MSVISVFGSSMVRLGDPDYADAVAVGGALAEAGYTVMTGGYGGMMEGASKGAAEAGGHVIGITTAQIESIRPNTQANAWVNEEIPYDKMEARLNHLIRKADGYVVMHGGVGTLNELVLAWELIRVREIPARPIVCYGDLWQRTLDAFLDARYVPEHHQTMVQFVNTPAEVIEALNQHA